jgi:ZIP family zinc transporter
MADLRLLGNVILLSLIAGLGTGLGGLLTIYRNPGRRSFGLLMGLTAGVMISLSFMELINKAWEMQGFWTTSLGFTAGAGCMFLLDFYIPHIRFGEVESHSREGDDVDCLKGHRHGKRHGRVGRAFFHKSQITNSKLLTSGILLALGITLHNLPEGIAVGAGYLHEPNFGLFVAFAIMLHNIPEGIATTMPLCECGVNRWVALRVAFLSGLAEPVGAMIAALFLSSFTSLIPAALAFAGGVMVFITLDELIPTAREFGHQHYTALGIILGTLCVFILSGVFGL